MYPDDLRYTPEHEWIRRESPTVLRFGITSFATEALGDVVYVALPAVGSALTGGSRAARSSRRSPSATSTPHWTGRSPR